MVVTRLTNLALLYRWSCLIMRAFFYDKFFVVRSREWGSIAIPLYRASSSYCFMGFLLLRTAISNMSKDRRCHQIGPSLVAGRTKLDDR